MASIAGRAVGSRPSRPCRSRMASNAGRAVGCRAPSRPCRSRMASNAGQAVSGWAPVQPYRSKTASNAGQAGVCRAPSRPCRSRTGLKRRPGYRDSRFLRHVGGAGPRRGTSSQTAGCGVNWSKTAVCAVCCGGTPTRPHPTVSYAANHRRVDKAVTDTGPLHSNHRECFRSPQRSVGDGLVLPHRRNDADETEGRGRVGVPPQQTAHTAALKRLTPHHAVCEEVPRPGPARPTRRTNREPHSPAGD